MILPQRRRIVKVCQLTVFVTFTVGFYKMKMGLGPELEPDAGAYLVYPFLQVFVDFFSAILFLGR